MLAWRKTGPVRARATAGLAGSRAADIYRRCAVGLYKQALLTLGDSALAGDVAGGVIADEGTLPPAPSSGEDEARYRLAEPVFRRYRQLTAGPAWPGRSPRSGPPGAWPTARIPAACCARTSGKRSGSHSPAASGMSGPAELWVHIRAECRPSLHTVLRRLASSSATSAAHGLLRDEGHRCRACDSGAAEEGGK